MRTLFVLTKRNIKLFFKDKGMFFPSLITPIILLVLYITFLAKVYKESFIAALPEGFTMTDKVMNATVNGQLVACLLAVSCVTVAFCSNLIMVQDKVNGVHRDFIISPVKPQTLSLSYYLGTLLNTLIICYVALIVGLIYIAITGWFLSFADVILLVLDIFILSMFGTAISSLINSFLKSQGQISAVGTIVSAGYGFICGAYMPISSFGKGLQHVLSFLPGTYGTSLLKKHALSGAFEQLHTEGIPSEYITGIKESLDCKISFFGHDLSTGIMYAIIICSTLLIIGAYITSVYLRRKRK